MSQPDIPIGADKDIEVKKDSALAEAAGEGHDSHNFQKLLDVILPKSVAKTWEQAKSEWSFFGAIHDDAWGHCACEHRIKERCFIQNKNTRDVVVIGNVCVDRFLGVSTTHILEMLRRMRTDKTLTLPIIIVNEMVKQNFIDVASRDFYSSVLASTTLSDKQFEWYMRINTTFLAAMRQGLLCLSNELLNDLKGLPYGKPKSKRKRKFEISVVGVQLVEVRASVIVDASDEQEARGAVDAMAKTQTLHEWKFGARVGPVKDQRVLSTIEIRQR